MQNLAEKTEFQSTTNSRVKPPRIGAIQPDRTLFAGISPDTGKPMFVQPRDMPRRMNWNRAAQGAQIFEGYRHNDWRLPTRNELKVLFENAAALGLDKKDMGHNWHWSSEEKSGKDGVAWVQSDDKTAQFVRKDLTLYTRYIRG